MPASCQLAVDVWGFRAHLAREIRDLSNAPISTATSTVFLKPLMMFVASSAAGLAACLLSWLQVAPVSAAAACNGVIDHLSVAAPSGFVTAGAPFGVSVTAL